MRERQVILLTAAQLDLADIDDLVSEMASDVIAARFVDRILQRVATLSYGSERGTVRTELQGLRVIGLMHNVSVAFVTTEDAVVVHRILYGGRNWLAVPTEGDDS